MKNRYVLIAAVCLLLVLAGMAFRAVRQEPEPWTRSQLMAPADLAKVVNDIRSEKPFIYCIGPGAIIKGSIDIGPGRDTANIAKLRELLEKQPKDAPIVIYCGCCPFANCPNIRPAFRLLNEMMFTHAKLLNLEHNIRVDWVNKGYPKN